MLIYGSQRKINLHINKPKLKFGDCLDFTTLFTCAKSKHFGAKVFNCFKYKAKSCDECNGPSLVLVSWKFSEGERKSEWKTRGNSIFLVFQQLFPFLKLNSPGRCFASTSEIRQFINLSFRCVSLFRNWNVRAANSFRISFEDGLKRRFFSRQRKLSNNHCLLDKARDCLLSTNEKLSNIFSLVFLCEGHKSGKNPRQACAINRYKSFQLKSNKNIAIKLC